MVLFFGPAGAGKSVQGQILAARHGWRWLSSGQLLRDNKDPEIHEMMRQGKLAVPDKVNEIIADAIYRAESIDTLILDGFPRLLEQAQWLVESQAKHSRSIQLVVVLDVPKEEVVKRLAIRGRADDTESVIAERLAIYESEIQPILDYLASQDIKVAHVDGVGTVGEVHDRVEAALVAADVVSS